MKYIYIRMSNIDSRLKMSLLIKGKGSYQFSLLSSNSLLVSFSSPLVFTKNINYMDKCQKCQTEITNDNSYTLQRKTGEDSIKICETCFKNNKTQYIKEYVFVKGPDGIIKEPKPVMDDGTESNFFECKKCGSVRNYETAGSSEFEKGCPHCQSKDFELKISLFNGILHYKVKECPKCHKMDMVDLLK